MDKQKISKFLIITSIATGITLSSAYLIYKRNKESKQFKRNSHSNFSITIHLSKDQVQNNEDAKKGSKIIVEGEEEQDFNDYISSLSSREEKNFLLNLFDKFINIFSRKENISDIHGTVIITKPNEDPNAVSYIDDYEEIDKNNTVKITKPNESVTNDNTAANTMTNITASTSMDGPITDIKALNDVIEQTLHLMNNNGNDSDSNNRSHISNASNSIRKNLSRTSLSSPTYSHSHHNSNHNSISGISSGQISGQSSSSTLIEKREYSDDIHNTNTASYDDDFYSVSQMTTETDIILHQAEEDEAIDADSEEENDEKIDEEIHYSTSHTPSVTRKRTETITNFNYIMNSNNNNNSDNNNKRNDEPVDSENENITPSTPKLKSSSYLTFSPLNARTPTAPISSSTTNHKTDNDSINPLSIDINNILMSPNFEFSDEDDGNTPIEDDMLSKDHRTLHRSSSISSTATFKSASSSWTDGQGPEEHPEVAPKESSVNDENWDVQSACSSTSGFYSAQEEFFDPTFD